MTRWTPMSIYLTALSYTTGIVILAGTLAVQAWSEWPTIRGTGTLQPTPHESSHRIEAVKPASRSFHTDSARVSSVGAIPGTHNPVFFALDGGRGHWSSQYGVRHTPARGVVLEVTETGRGPTFTPWRREIVAASHLCGVEIRRIASIVARESGWNHRAVSTAGARGLMQLMPKTARMMGVDDSFDPQQNLIGGACYYRMLFDRFKSHHRASVAFHRGPNAKGPTPQASHDYATDIIEGIAN